MSADRLREAAKVLRERAEDATFGPWSARTAEPPTFVEVCSAEDDLIYRRINDIQAASDATYVATMHPGVGLAPADWLICTYQRANVDAEVPYFSRALAVADAILGGAA